MLNLKTVLTAGVCCVLLTGVAGCNQDTAETNVLIAEQTRAIQEQNDLQRQLIAMKVAEDAELEDSHRRARALRCKVRGRGNCGS